MGLNGATLRDCPYKPQSSEYLNHFTSHRLCAIFASYFTPDPRLFPCHLHQSYRRCVKAGDSSHRNWTGFEYYTLQLKVTG